MSFSSRSRESERCRWVHFAGVARFLMNYHVLLFMPVVVTSQCLNVVYIVVSNCLLSRTTGGLNEGITILQRSDSRDPDENDILNRRNYYIVRVT